MALALVGLEKAFTTQAISYGTSTIYLNVPFRVNNSIRFLSNGLVGDLFGRSRPAKIKHKRRINVPRAHHSPKTENDLVFSI